MTRRNVYFDTETDNLVNEYIRETKAPKELSFSAAVCALIKKATAPDKNNAEELQKHANRIVDNYHRDRQTYLLYMLFFMLKQIKTDLNIKQANEETTKRLEDMHKKIEEELLKGALHDPNK